jgi:ribonuclease-3
MSKLTDPRRQKDLQRLVERLGLTDTEAIAWPLMDLALTHPSISPLKNYEQLEFVGDAVIRLATSEVLFAEYPDEPVGEFAAVRSILVSDRTLAEFARYYDLGRYLLVQGNYNEAGQISLLADAFEALIGALYLSTHDMSLIHPWIDPHIQQKTAEIRQDPARQNYKDALQEWTQGKYHKLPRYRVSENPQFISEEARFIAEVWLETELLGQGEGRSKKAAEQAAAQKAFILVTTSPPE